MADDIEGLISAVSGAGKNGSGHVLVPESYQEKAEQLSTRLVSAAAGPGKFDDKRAIKEFNLAYDLIFNIAGITVDDIEMLENALRDGKTGQVRSVLDKINHALSIKLRFPRIWSQDRNFALRVEATEHELSFLISDRTEREYSFDERSSGLQHFLSYYVQYLSHTTPEGVSNEILLMDEPDAFLSGEALQDLLKIFQMFADPLSAGKGPDSIPIQVIYVTHSPFLIDKNHAERIRALEKPGGSKGTRVINKPAQNRYEPLRSALGAYVGETAFISQCNLMVEGPADQILLAGAATYLRRLGDVPESELLDLNRITIVPCGGASNAPYMVYLARGRDTEKPAVITLLDSDKDGNDAKRDLSKIGPHPGNRAVLPENFILQLGDISADEIGAPPGPQPPFNVLEDLIPRALAVQVAREYLSELFGLAADAVPNLTVEYLDANKVADESFFGAIDKLVRTIEPAGSYHIDKVPFARTLIDMLPALAKNRSDDPEKPIPELDRFEANMRTVFKRLRKIQTAAEGDVREKDMRRKVAEKVDTFLGDFRETGAARRDDVSRLLADIESDLNGNERESSFILQTSMRLKKDHALDEDPTELVASFEELVDGLESIKNADVMAARTPNPEVLPRSIKGTEPAGNPRAAGQLAKVRPVKSQKHTPPSDDAQPGAPD